MNRSPLLGLVALAAAASATPAKAAVLVSGDPVLYWNQQMLSVLSGSPTAGARSIAMVNIAIHDAVNASLGGPNRSWLPGGIGSTGDVRAATSVAAHNVLFALFPSQGAALNAALANSLAIVPDGAAKTTGMTTGALIASAILAARANDGSTFPSPYVPVGGPGRWVPTTPGVPPSLPQYANVDPFLTAAPGTFRVPPPPAIGSPEYAAYLNEVKQIGAAGSLTRTADQSAAALYWAAPQAAGTGPWIRAFMDQSALRGLDSITNASILAQLSAAVADVTFAVWNNKYHYDYWRPVTAIRNADTDGNPLTEADPGWSPYVNTPPHPSYVSAHSAVAATAAAVLSARLGGGSAFCLTIGTERCWADYDAAMLDAANSRLWGGIHFRFDNEAGLALGNSVAHAALSARAFAAVPEPSSWALFVGFGFIGGVLRRRQGRIRPRIAVPA